MSLAFLRAYRFSKLDTPVHRLDPRTKLVMTVAFTLLGVTTLDPLEILILLLVQLIILAASRSLLMWLRSLRALLLFLVLILLAQALATGNLLQSAFFALRFVVVASATSWFFFTTSPEDLGRALEQLGISADVALSFTLSMRFIPVIAEEFQSIFDAQRARGLDVGKGGLWERTRSLLPVLVPLFVGVIRRTYEIADALELRGYGALKSRTRWKDPKFGGADVLALLALVALSVGLIYYRLVVPPLDLSKFATLL
ncbi:MAG TPA: energy-coupling factor transporter transmembrane component T [Thermoproteota archaeon]|nr:energy-coupling factor transporter transmembrane component T [Thermoproteota archaeon]